jgi:hypothetical protein
MAATGVLFANTPLLHNTQTWSCSWFAGAGLLQPAILDSKPAIPLKINEIKLWLLQLILQKVFGLTLEFRNENVSKTTLFETEAAST